MKVDFVKKNNFRLLTEIYPNKQAHRLIIIKIDGFGNQERDRDCF